MADDQLRQVGVPPGKLVARHPYVGDLDDAFADAKAIALGQPLQIDPAGGEVLADLAIGNVHALFPQPRVEFFAVEAHGPIESAVVFAVALLVALNALAPDARREHRPLGHAAVGHVDLSEQGFHREVGVLARPHFSGKLSHILRSLKVTV